MKSRRESIRSSSYLVATKDIPAVARRVPLRKLHGELSIERHYTTLHYKETTAFYSRGWVVSP